MAVFDLARGRSCLVAFARRSYTHRSNTDEGKVFEENQSVDSASVDKDRLRQGETDEQTRWMNTDEQRLILERMAQFFTPP